MGRFNEFLQIQVIKGKVNLLPMFLQKSFAIAKTPTWKTNPILNKIDNLSWL
jgi:hypothetical protein